MATWARQGRWHGLPDDSADALDVLQGLTREQREVLASMLAESFVSGVHEALVVLHDELVPPFDDPYEGTPFHDFMGRMVTDWPWPDRGP